MKRLNPGANLCVKLWVDLRINLGDDLVDNTNRFLDSNLLLNLRSNPMGIIESNLYTNLKKTLRVEI